MCMGDVCMTCGVHGMWCTLHEELHGFSQHDIDNVRVAWQCSFKTVQTLCFKMALVVHGGQREDLCRCTPPWRKQCAYCIWENLDHSGKLNSVTLTGRMVSPTYARSFQTPQGATLLLDAVCAVMQATCAILDSSMCAPRRTCKWFLFGAILTHQNTLQCVRGWA